jgi:hypothetical protein
MSNSDREKSLVIQALLETCQIDMYMDTCTKKKKLDKNFLLTFGNIDNTM